MSRGQQNHDFSNIRAQLIVFDTRFHLLRRGLQVLPYFKTDPHLQHGCVAFAYALEERSASALGAELTEDGESAARSVSDHVERSEGKGDGWTARLAS